MDPEQFVAQLAELRTDQQLHQALQQVQQQQKQQQQQSQQESVCHSLLRKQWDRQCWPQQIQHEPIHSWWMKGSGKSPPLKNTESEFVSWARRTENFVVSVHPGARDVLTWSVEKELATVAEANAATEVLTSIAHSTDDPCGRRIIRHPCGLWIWRRSGSLAASA